MISRVFKFGPQPALDKAIAEQRAAEQALIAARRSLEEEKRKLERILSDIEKNRQRIRAEHDNLTSPRRQISDPRELTHISRFIDSLRDKEKALLQAADRQRQQIAFAKDRVDLRQRELAEAVSRVQALEKLKEQRRLEHEAAVEKAEEKQRDDEAIQLWNNRPRSPQA
jgi:flagellar biosynthesis chaperone FliJ